MKDLARGAGVGGTGHRGESLGRGEKFLEKAGKRLKKWREGVKEGVHRTEEGRLLRVWHGKGRDPSTRPRNPHLVLLGNWGRRGWPARASCQVPALCGFGSRPSQDLVLAAWAACSRCFRFRQVRVLERRGSLGLELAELAEQPAVSALGGLPVCLEPASLPSPLRPVLLPCPSPLLLDPSLLWPRFLLFPL